MSHFGISGAYPIFACSVLLGLCVILPLLSEHERVCAWIDRCFVWIFPEATGEDL